MTEKDSLADPLVDEIMTGFKNNAKGVTEDIISGIEMFSLAAHLALGFGILVGLYTVLLIISGYYKLDIISGAAGAAGSVVGAVIFVGFYFWLIRKYKDLKKKYASLFDLFQKLGVA